METVEIVIKINKDEYNFMKHCYGIRAFSGHYIAKQIVNGTVLPKGHGDLKDIAEIERLWQRGDYDSIVSALLFAPTIIEADKEVENG